MKGKVSWRHTIPAGYCIIRQNFVLQQDFDPKQLKTVYKLSKNQR